MKPRCAGFVHSRSYQQGWEPCRRPAARGDKFCAAHREGFDAAMLSVAAENIAADVKERKIEAERRARKRAVRKAARREIIPHEEIASAPRRQRADVYGERIFAAVRGRSIPNGGAGGQSARAKTPAAPPASAAGRSDAQIRPR